MKEGKFTGRVLQRELVLITHLFTPENFAGVKRFPPQNNVRSIKNRVLIVIGLNKNAIFHFPEVSFDLNVNFRENHFVFCFFLSVFSHFRESFREYFGQFRIFLRVILA